MIILWKWHELEDDKCDHDIVKVAKSEDDKIIRINIRDVNKIIQLIIEFASIQKGDVFIFLHRNHDLDESHVEEILKLLHPYLRKRRIKCFLFSNARDFIYYQTGKEGLLDSIGLFANGYFKFEDEDGNEYEEKISVLEYDENGQRLGVKYQHFNRTWNYYYNEFYDKIKTLGVDLMTRITLNEAINQKLTTKEWNTYLSKFIADDNRLVWYRLKSLLGYYAFSENTNKENKLLLGKELDNLKDYEEQTEISFSFDDVKVNLEKHYRKTVQVAYGKLCKKLVPIIENNENATIISIEEIRDVFGKLLKTLE